MKTPREIIMECHVAAELALDAIRQHVVTEVKPSVPTSHASVLKLLWIELILPCRRVWIGLASVWVVILVLNFEGHAPSASEASRVMASEISPQAMSMLTEQWRLEDEILAVTHKTSVVRRVDPLVRPRGEYRLSIALT